MFADPTFWAFVGLILFFVVIAYFKVPGMMASGLDKRGDAVRDELEQARRLREEAEALLAQYKQKAAAAEAEAGEIVAAESKTRLEEYVASRTKLAEQKIAQAEAEALQEVKALSAEVAVAAAEQIIAARVKAGEGASLIAKSISDVRSKLN
jgi:F-type H+-transporting ATPase subunit b